MEKHVVPRPAEPRSSAVGDQFISNAVGNLRGKSTHGRDLNDFPIDHFIAVRQPGFGLGINREGHGLPPTNQFTGSAADDATRSAAQAIYHFPFSPSGTGLFVSPVAAHSTPRTRSAWKPRLFFIAGTSCPSTFSTTRPLP